MIDLAHDQPLTVSNKKTVLITDDRYTVTATCSSKLGTFFLKIVAMKYEGLYLGNTTR